MLKVAVVGCGYWGPNLVRNLLESNRAQVEVFDLDRARMEKVRRRYPSVELAPSFESLLEPGIQGIVIATTVSSHFPLAKTALEAGKHVLVEKPMAASVSEAERLIALAEKRKLVLMVGHTFLYSPSVHKVKEIIDSGALGDLLFITCSRVNLGIHQKDVSVIWDLGPHDFSVLLNWLDDRPVKVWALGRECVQKGVLDVAFINVEFAAGTVGHLEVAWLAPSKLRRTVIVGTKKMLVYDDTQAVEKVKIYDHGVTVRDPESFGEYQLIYRTGDISIPRIDTYEPLSAEINDFLTCIEKGTNPRSDGRLGLEVIRLLEAAEKSARAGGKAVDIGKA
jgi:predicted dehydrogenase